MGLLVQFYSEVSWLHLNHSCFYLSYIEKALLQRKNTARFKQEFLTDNEVTYALIYQQETLPATGSSTSVLTALGLLAVGSLVLLVHKKKKVSSLFLVTTIGLISLSSMQALDISNPLKAPSNEGVVQIAGYRYIGYLPLNDNANFRNST